MKECVNLLQNVVPEMWTMIWEGPELPLNYIKSLGKKLLALNNYNKSALNDTVLNSNINLSEFLHPEAFLSALRQKTARKNKIPIDQMLINCDFEANPYKGEIIFAKITGLFLQGSDFDGSRLIEITGNKSEILSLPTLNIFWKKLNSEQNSGTMDIPVYENIFREHFICKFKIPISGKLDDTILKGIAICLD
jgi:dynein heavy chain 2